MPASDLIFTDDPHGTWTRAVQAGRARRLGRGIYTTDTGTPPEAIVRDHTWEIVRNLLPDAVVTDRTRRDLRLPEQGHVVIFCARPGRRRRIELPGLTIAARPGTGALDDDNPFIAGARIASEARALLENARPTRASGALPRRTLTREELEDWIAQLAAARSADQLDAIRDRTRELAPLLGYEREQPAVDRLISVALGTSTSSTRAPALGARQRGRPWDARRIDMFDQLAVDLANHASVVRPVPPADPRGRLLPFFESYFSNFIEGTEFEIDVAERIVFAREIPPGRPADAHDVLGTYELVADDNEMNRRPGEPDAFVEILRDRHRVLMRGRPEKHPGSPKEENNRAAAYVFVDHTLVLGTLERSFEGYTRLLDPFARALYMMFVVTEVHPFDDGNGRLARVMMNAELVASGQQRIVIPTVFRYEYLNALRLLSNHGNADALVSVLDFAQRWTARVDWSSHETAIADLERTNALVDPHVAGERGIRLRLS